MIATEDDKYLPEALEHLEYALSRDDRNAFAWHQASVAHHRLDNEAMTRLASAERFLLIGNVQAAMVNAGHAVKKLPKETPKWYRAQDILYISRSNLEAQGKGPKRSKKPPKAEDKPDKTDESSGNEET